MFIRMSAPHCLDANEVAQHDEHAALAVLGDRDCQLQFLSPASCMSCFELTSAAGTMCNCSLVGVQVCAAQRMLAVFIAV